MQTAAELNAHFAIPCVLRFDEDRNGFVRAQVSTPAVDATVYLQGAHLTFWQPVGAEPVLFSGADKRFLSEHASHVGVPVIFPWFGAKTLGAKTIGATIDNAPSHGFTRQQVWNLAFAAQSGVSVHLTFTLEPTDLSRSFGYGPFRLALNLTIGAALHMELTVANDDTQPLVFEEALHTYLAVDDVREITVEGLTGTEYLDKPTNFQRLRQQEKFLHLAQYTDRVYLNTTATCILHDPLMKRLITIEKSSSATTVVWNPWPELAANFNDVGRDAWHRFLCIESANAAEDAITLAPGQTHTMRATIHVEKMGYR